MTAGNMTLTEAKMFAEHVKRVVPIKDRYPAFEACVILYEALGGKYEQSLDQLSAEFKEADHE